MDLFAKINRPRCFQPPLYISKQNRALVYWYIRENYQDPASLKELSVLFSIRPDVLSYQFKKQYGGWSADLNQNSSRDRGTVPSSRPQFTVKEIGYQVDASTPQAYRKKPEYYL